MAGEPLEELFIQLSLKAENIEGKIDATLKQASAAAEKHEAGINQVLDRTSVAANAFSVALGSIAATALTAFAAKASEALSFVSTDAVKAASDMSESANKVSVVFGGSADAIQSFASSAATSLGMSKGEALAAAGTFGGLFAAMEIGEETSADMSKGLLSLGSDLASFNNIDPTVALEKLRAGLIGETEPLRTLGVNLSAAAVETRALEMGFQKTGKELSASAKAQAAYALILEQTKTAQGDFANTSTGMANSQRIIAAQFKDLQATIGQQLLPLIGPLISAFATGLPGAIAAVTGPLEVFGGTIRSLVSGEGVDLLYTKINETFSPETAGRIASLLDPLFRIRDEGFGAVIELGRNLLTFVGDMVQELGVNLAQWGQEFILWIGPAIPPLLQELGSLAGDVWGWIRANGPTLLKTFVSEFVPAAVAWVAEAAMTILQHLPGILWAIGSWVVTEGIPGIVGFALEMGEALITGLLQGLANLGARVGQLVMRELNAVVASAKAALGISSPSKVFADEIGEPIVEGVIEGIESQAEELLSTVSGVLEPGLEAAEQAVDSYGDHVANVAKLAAAAFKSETDSLVSHTQQGMEQMARALSDTWQKALEFESGVRATVESVDSLWRNMYGSTRGEMMAQARSGGNETRWRQNRTDVVNEMLSGAGIQGGALSGIWDFFEANVRSNWTQATMTRLQQMIAAAAGQVPSFAQGGTVPGMIGMPQLVVAHGGEHISPPASSMPEQSGPLNHIAVIAVDDAGLNWLQSKLRVLNQREDFRRGLQPEALRGG